jgi:alcohol dehydrogenase (NADP+)
MPYPDKFTGFQVNGPDTWLEFHKNEFQPKPFGDYDVDIQIECCGVCGSDVHTLNGGWGEQKFPLAVGHGESERHVQTGVHPTDNSQRSSARPSAWAPR